jgi:aspartate-semialdehyde dehydrogenase
VLRRPAGSKKYSWNSSVTAVMAANGIQPKKRCGVLGATGSVGQRFILLLADHPVLHLQAVGASSRSAGKPYKEAARWKQQRPMSKQLGALVVRECKSIDFADCDLVFSGLDSDVAGDVGGLSVTRCL